MSDKPSTPSDRLSFFNEAAREAAKHALAPFLTMRCGECAGTGYSILSNLDCRSCGGSGCSSRLASDIGTEATTDALTAALDALPPRSKAFLALAELSVQEQREAIMDAIATDFGACSNVTADRVLTALGLPVEQETTESEGR